MNELLYFSSSDVMIQVAYKKEENTIHYFSHRQLSFGERVIVEQYLLTNVAVKTEYYKKHPAVLNYNGIKSQLVKDLNQFHLKNTISVLKQKDEEVLNSVKNLIAQSMTNYYFEQIGETILEIRKAADSLNTENIADYKQRLEVLIEAYNAHSERNVSLEKIMPNDLRTHFA